MNMPGHAHVRICFLCLARGADKGHARQACAGRTLCSLCYLGASAKDKAVDNFVYQNVDMSDPQPDMLEELWGFYEFHGMR